MIFENENVYKTLKKIWQYVIPAIACLWEILYTVWNIPYGQQIYLTIWGVWVAFAVFLGISKYRFKNAQEGYLGDGIEEGEEEYDAIDIDEYSTDNNEQ